MELSGNQTKITFNLILNVFFPFRDICPVLYDCNALRTVTDILTEHIKANFAGVDAIVGSCKIFLC